MNRIKLKPVDWSERTLIKLKRKYRKDEVIAALDLKNKELLNDLENTNNTVLYLDRRIRELEKIVHSKYKENEELKKSIINRNNKIKILKEGILSQRYNKYLKSFVGRLINNIEQLKNGKEN